MTAKKDTARKSDNKGKQPAKAADPVVNNTLPAEEAIKNASEKKPLGKTQAEKKATELFSLYPKTTEFHFTSDNTGFFTRNDAENHAASLKDKTITLIKKG